ncbi:MAG: ABC transporter ATP-binding protein [Limisphaerales bacterium]|nr:MAG: ABC transporter ATP-binding protein [Limisphaerales bacterium]KAG0510063.1 MAG: ABC transporter ATP-binding protein [Limisphaerales bacterium]TXT52906.1 MAG: ABC transporter ATP-binding protein [Limisphaerales bacterium]
MRIELRGVLKDYGGTRALDHVKLEFAPGQIVALLGANGAGKSTLLRCLGGVIAPSKGDIYFDDEPFRRDRLDQRRRFAFLPDFPFLFPEKTVLRNISIILRLYEADGSGAEDRVLALLREFDLLPLAQMPVAALSRGQSYKTALVGLLAVDPDLWLLDEPFASGMDPHAINAFKTHARTAVARGRTVIYSTQILEVAERFCDRACVIQQGEIRAFASVTQLREQAADKANVLQSLLDSLREAAL